MKKLSKIFFLFSVICIFAACNGNDTNTKTSTLDSTMATTTDSMSSTSDSIKNISATAMVDDKARNFVTEAVAGGMMEVELGKMAENNGKSQQVKDFGIMMVGDHSAVNENLKSIATKKNIDFPASLTDDQKKDIDKLSKKKGADFDRAYVSMMIDDHKKDIDVFKKASGNLNDNDLKNFATNTLPTLQKHLDAIQGIKNKM